MNAEPLCLRTFGEIIRRRVDKKMRKKEYLPDKKFFESDGDVKDRETINGSGIANFYSQILLEAILYYPKASGEAGLPDITSTMCTKLRKGQSEVHGNIVSLAQRKKAAELASDFFDANLIPNIPQAYISIVLDAVDALIQSDSSLGATKQKELKRSRKDKTPAGYLAEVLIIAVCSEKNVDIAGAQSPQKDTTTDVLEALQKADDLLATLPAPPQLTPPKKIAKQELKYIAELFAAYGDAESVPNFNENSLQTYPDYADDLQDRRIDYFAADSIRRGVSELQGDRYQGQFEVLKAETHSGVKDTARRVFSNGYERMLVVMEQAVVAPVNGYLLSNSHNWINSNIKKGVCHFLVIDDKLKWVK